MSEASILGEVAELTNLHPSSSYTPIDLQPREDEVPNTVKIETIAFSEDKNRWITFYSYMPDVMAVNNISFVSWQNGKLYRHEQGLYNTFYSTQSNTEITTLCNEAPSNIKFYKSIVLESNKSTNIEATNQFGQKTSLVESDFENVEGVYKASFLKDENTPNIDNPLLEGDEMRCHSMTVKSWINTNEYFRLFKLDVRSEFSELTNR